VAQEQTLYLDVLLQSEVVVNHQQVEQLQMAVLVLAVGMGQILAVLAHQAKVIMVVLDLVLVAQVMLPEVVAAQVQRVEMVLQQGLVVTEERD
jgi:hypothetical protein